MAELKPTVMTHDAEASSETSSEKPDLLSREHLNPVLNAKMHLVNNVSPGPTPSFVRLKLTVPFAIRPSMRSASLHITTSYSSSTASGVAHHPYRSMHGTYWYRDASYAVDSLILLIQSIIAGSAAAEFHPSYTRGLTIAVYVGMLVGAL